MTSYGEEQLIGAIANELIVWKERCERFANIINSYGLNDDPVLTEKDKIYLLSNPTFDREPLTFLEWIHKRMDELAKSEDKTQYHKEVKLLNEVIFHNFSNELEELTSRVKALEDAEENEDYF